MCGTPNPWKRLIDIEEGRFYFTHCCVSASIQTEHDTKARQYRAYTANV